MIFVRSLLFNLLFYINLGLLLLIGIITFVLPRSALLELVRIWGRSSTWLLRVICGVRFEVRGREKIPAGGCLVAAKHQSIFETFALPMLLGDFTFILKRELQWIPLFGWLTIKGKQIAIDRGAGASATMKMLEQAREAIAEQRQIIIFPEGTRRAPGAEPAYKFGAARLYAALGVPCVPVALNTGVFWPRRKFLRFPGTIVIEVLDPIEPGMESRAFFDRLQSTIETANSRLVEEGFRERVALGGPPADAF